MQIKKLILSIILLFSPCGPAGATDLHFSSVANALSAACGGAYTNSLLFAYKTFDLNNSGNVDGVIVGSADGVNLKWTDINSALQLLGSRADGGDATHTTTGTLIVPAGHWQTQNSLTSNSQYNHFLDSILISNPHNFALYGCGSTQTYFDSKFDKQSYCTNHGSVGGGGVSFIPDSSNDPWTDVTLQGFKVTGVGGRTGVSKNECLSNLDINGGNSWSAGTTAQNYFAKETLPGDGHPHYFRCKNTGGCTTEPVTDYDSDPRSPTQTSKNWCDYGYIDSVAGSHGTPFTGVSYSNADTSPGSPFSDQRVSFNSSARVTQDCISGFAPISSSGISDTLTVSDVLVTQCDYTGANFSNWNKVDISNFTATDCGAEGLGFSSVTNGAATNIDLETSTQNSDPVYAAYVGDLQQGILGIEAGSATQIVGGNIVAQAQATNGVTINNLTIKDAFSGIAITGLGGGDVKNVTINGVTITDVGTRSDPIGLQAMWSNSHLGADVNAIILSDASCKYYSNLPVSSSTQPNTQCYVHDITINGGTVGTAAHGILGNGINMQNLYSGAAVPKNYHFYGLSFNGMQGVYDRQGIVLGPNVASSINSGLDFSNNTVISASPLQQAIRIDSAYNGLFSGNNISGTVANAGDATLVEVTNTTGLTISNNTLLTTAPDYARSLIYFGAGSGGCNVVNNTMTLNSGALTGFNCIYFSAGTGGYNITGNTCEAWPTVTTNAISGVTSTTAGGGGNIISNGGGAITADGVCWSTSMNPTTAASCSNDGNGTALFASSITGLTPNTVYQVRAYATNAAGTAYGSDLQFTTSPAVAEVGQYALTVNITGAGSGTVTDDTDKLTWSENTGTANYNQGTLVALSAAADSTSTFTGWSGACHTWSAICNVTMNTDEEVTAHYVIKGTTPFSDVTSGSTYESYIESIYDNGITTGCGYGDYCPSEDVTRDQMAAFIVRALYGENFTYTQTPYFSDVPAADNFFKYIQKLKDMHITTLSSEYFPSGGVSRGQMAAFLVRALQIQAGQPTESFQYTQTPYFTDVPAGSTYFSYVQRLKDLGITTVTGIYNVDGIVTREQMAAFIARAFLGMN